MYRTTSGKVKKRYDFPVHEENDRFFYPWEDMIRPPGVKDSVRILRFLAGQAHKTLFPADFRWDEIQEPYRFSSSNGNLSITFLGHSCLLIQFNGFRIVTDPFLSRRASFSQKIGPARRIPAVLPADTFPDVDLILLSHNHFDHMDMPALETLGDRAVKLVPLGDGRHLARSGLYNYIEMDWGENFSLNGLNVTFLPAKHFSARTALDRNRSLWGSYLIEIGSKVIYFSGDTAMGSVFSGLADKLPPIDAALISIGSYDPQFLMKDSHLTPEEAILLARILDARKMIPIHWGTIELAAETLTEPAERLKMLIENGFADGLEIDILPAGRTIDI